MSIWFIFQINVLSKINLAPAEKKTTMVKPWTFKLPKCFYRNNLKN